MTRKDLQMFPKSLEKAFREYPLYSQDGMGGYAHVVAKWFCPWGAGTWLATEGSPTPDGDWEFFGLVNLGWGWEFGYFTLSQLKSVEGPFGLWIERDSHLRGDETLRELADGMDWRPYDD